MAFTTSFFAVDSPREGESEMDVDDNGRNNAGSRVGENANDNVARETVHSPQSANPNGSSHLTSHIQPSSSLSQKDGDSRFDPDKPDPAEHQNGATGSEATMPPKKALKKKGTATAVPKPPKRAGKGPGAGGGKKGVSSGKPSAGRKKNGGAPDSAAAPGGDRSSSAAPTADSSQNGDGDGDDGDDESDSGPYCICRGPDNHRFMIACDRCEDWFHGDCIGMDKYTGENLVQRYICPNCTDGRLYVTRYRKTCALAGCDRPARMYGDDATRRGGADASIFCSDEHCQLWWEQLVATLPKSRTGGLYGDVLTQEEFMGLLGNPARKKGGEAKDGGWKLGDKPFGIPPDFWDTVPPSEVLTEEESNLLANSVAGRHSLGEEIVLCKKMLQLIDMAVKQRESLIASSSGAGAGGSKPASQSVLGKDFCGYDYRLDTVGATADFAAFVKSPAGEAIFRAGRLPLPGDDDYLAVTDDGEMAVDANSAAVTTAAAAAANGVGGGAGGVAELAAVMCTKKKCKPHAGWSGIHTKNVKHQIKELAAQAKEKLDFEARIRDCAAVRYQRRKREKNGVEVVSREVEMED